MASVTEIRLSGEKLSIFCSKSMASGVACGIFSSHLTGGLFYNLFK
jgi:hypothetical protein